MLRKSPQNPIKFLYCIVLKTTDSQPTQNFKDKNRRKFEWEISGLTIWDSQHCCFDQSSARLNWRKFENNIVGPVIALFANRARVIVKMIEIDSEIIDVSTLVYFAHFCHSTFACVAVGAVFIHIFLLKVKFLRSFTWYILSWQTSYFTKGYYTMSLDRVRD
jgi:hypothetical protein